VMGVPRTVSNETILVEGVAPEAMLMARLPIGRQGSDRRLASDCAQARCFHLACARLTPRLQQRTIPT
jgi:hypothetical protein